MWQHSNPITQDINQDCQEIITHLDSHQGDLREKIKVIKDMKEQKSKTKDLGLRGQIEDLTRKLEAINQNEIDLIPDMTQIKSLYKQKQKYERLKMEIPGELMNKLVEKVINVKTEKLKAKRETEDILDDYEAIQNNYLKNPLKSASKSILKRPDLIPVPGRNGAKGKRNLLKDPHSGDGLSLSAGVSLENTKKDPRMFTDYLKNYEAELSKSLLVMEPGTLEFQKRMGELSKISEMKNNFMEFDMKEQLMKQRGLDEAKKLRNERMRKLDPDKVGSKLKLINDGTMAGVEQTRMDNEAIRKLEMRLVRMDETVRGMEDLVREKEKLASLQRQKYDVLERERHQVEIERIRADRERAEADHLRRLQRMNNELDYVEQMKLKTMNVLSTQLKSFSQMKEDRWKKRKEAEKEYQKQKLMDVQKEFVLREKKRQAQFDAYMLRLEEKMGMAVNIIDKDKQDRLRRNMNANIGNEELREIFGVGDNFHDQKYQDQLENLAGGYNNLEDADRRNIINRKSRDFRRSRGSNFSKKKSKNSRRGSTRTISSLKTKINDDESDPDSVFIFVKQICNLPENSTLTMIISALIDANGDIIMDLGQTIADLDSDSLNPKFNAKFKAPLNLFSNKKELYFYCEIKTLDDGISSLPSVIYGSVILPLTGKNRSIAAPIYFESFHEEIINELKSDNLEVYVGSFMALTEGKGKVNQSTRFKEDKLLKTENHKKAKKILKKRDVEIINQKLDVVVQERDFIKRDELERILKKDDDKVKWITQRYYIPVSKQKSSISIKPIGFLFLDPKINSEKEELFFSRTLRNPDPSKESRPTKILDNHNWNSRINFQLMDEREIVYNYKDVSKNTTQIFEIIGAFIENGELQMRDVGISVIPLMDEEENVTFGIYVLPVFDQNVNKESLDFFADKNGIDMIERMYTDENVYVADTFMVVKISDGFRKDLFRNHMRFDKYSFDFVLDAEDDLFSSENLTEIMNSGKQLKELQIADYKEQVISGVKEFCEAHPIFR